MSGRIRRRLCVVCVDRNRGGEGGNNIRCKYMIEAVTGAGDGWQRGVLCQVFVSGVISCVHGGGGGNNRCSSAVCARTSLPTTQAPTTQKIRSILCTTMLLRAIVVVC